MKQANKSGFTLVELSIVLVIIGLLIGGILVGQSLIESAKIQSFIRQIGQYDAAVGVFKDKFGNLPGDNALFGTTTTTGVLGDGTITDADNVAVDFASEIGGFWADLSASGLKNEEGNSEVFTGTASRLLANATPPDLNIDMPQAKVGTNTAIMAAGLAGVNYYYLYQENQADQVNTVALSLKPADVLTIDSKLDDGDGDAGNVIGDADLGAFDTGATPTTTLTTCVDAAGVYAVTTTTDACSARIRIGSSTGVLQ